MKYLKLYIFCFFLVIHNINCEKLDCEPILEDEKLNINFKITPHYFTPPSCASYSSSISPDDNLKVYLRNSCFHPDNNKLYIIIHGFHDSASADWVTKIVTELIHQDRNINIIAIDWSGAFSFGPNLYNVFNYRRAALATSTAATQISKYLKGVARLINIPLYNWKNIHFIGHSLGAHVAGQTARKLNIPGFFTVHRVTGLDPAYPCFEDASSFQRLKKSDAQFVDVIHTNSEPGENPNLGTFEPLGHMDFYLNGGNNQKCCNSSREAKFFKDPLEVVFGIKPYKLFKTVWNRQIVPVCDHNFAPLFFAQSIQYMNSAFPVLVTPAEYSKNKPVLPDKTQRGGTVEVGINAIKYKLMPGIYYADSTIEGCPKFPPVLNIMYKFYYG